MSSVLVAAAAGVAGAALLLALVTAWALARLRGHHRELARSVEVQRLEIAKVAAQARDELREVERRGQRALVERFAAHEAARTQRDRLRGAIEEVIAAAATGELGVQSTRVLVAQLHQLERELDGPTDRTPAPNVPG